MDGWNTPNSHMSQRILSYSCLCLLRGITFALTFYWYGYGLGGSLMKVICFALHQVVDSRFSVLNIVLLCLRL